MSLHTLCFTTCSWKRQRETERRGTGERRTPRAGVGRAAAPPPPARGPGRPPPHSCLFLSSWLCPQAFLPHAHWAQEHPRPGARAAGSSPCRSEQGRTPCAPHPPVHCLPAALPPAWGFSDLNATGAKRGGGGFPSQHCPHVALDRALGGAAPLGWSGHGCAPLSPGAAQACAVLQVGRGKGHGKARSRRFRPVPGLSRWASERAGRPGWARWETSVSTTGSVAPWGRRFSAGTAEAPAPVSAVSQPRAAAGAHAGAQQSGNRGARLFSNRG